MKKESNLTTAVQQVELDEKGRQTGNLIGTPVPVNAKTAHLLRNSPEYQKVALKAPPVPEEVAAAVEQKQVKTAQK